MNTNENVFSCIYEKNMEALVELFPINPYIYDFEIETDTTYLRNDGETKAEKETSLSVRVMYSSANPDITEEYNFISDLSLYGLAGLMDDDGSDIISFYASSAPAHNLPGLKTHFQESLNMTEFIDYIYITIGNFMQQIDRMNLGPDQKGNDVVIDQYNGIMSRIDQYKSNADDEIRSIIEQCGLSKQMREDILDPINRSLNVFYKECGMHRNYRQVARLICAETLDEYFEEYPARSEAAKHYTAMYKEYIVPLYKKMYQMIHHRIEYVRMYRLMYNDQFTNRYNQFMQNPEAMICVPRYRISRDKQDRPTEEEYMQNLEELSGTVQEGIVMPCATYYYKYHSEN